MRQQMRGLLVSAMILLAGCGGGGGTGTGTGADTGTDTGAGTHTGTGSGTGTGTGTGSGSVNSSTPSTATITMSDSELLKGETSLVSIVLSEATSGLETSDLVAPNGTLSPLTTSDNITWKTTFTPTEGVVDDTNLITLVGTTVTSANFTINTNTIIDVLAIYTKEADESIAGGATAKINHFFAVANKINKDSLINLTYNVVHIEESTEIWEDPDLEDGKGNDDISANLDYITDNSDAVHALRDKYKADEVVGYLALARNCGNGWMNDTQNPDLAYAMVPIDCSADSTAHEVGHNLGLNHSHRQADEGQFPFSVGYGIDEEFVTVMAYQSFFGDPDIALYFSNPTIQDCGTTAKFDCGVDIDQPEPAYAAESIRRVMDTVAAYR